jgi:hypothetical protein
MTSLFFIIPLSIIFLTLTIGTPALIIWYFFGKD